jgi:hypothetical protein
VRAQLDHIARAAAGIFEQTDEVKALQSERNELLDLKRKLEQGAAEPPRNP